MKFFKLSIRHNFLLSLYSLLFFTTLTLFQAETQLWKQCNSFNVNIPLVGETTFDECISLNVGDSCQLLGRLTINNSPVFEQTMDISGQSQVCGPLPGFSMCQACTTLAVNTNNTAQQCALLAIKCNGITLSTQNIGCFDSNTILDELSKCRNDCPNQCSKHGTCYQGVCTCVSGYYGLNCNTSIPTYGRCVNVPVEGQLQPLCGEFTFANCYMSFNVKLADNSIYSTSFPLYEFTTIFDAPYCVSLFNCSICMGWTNLTINYQLVAGCSAVSMGCGSQLNNYPLFCFEDSQIVPYCLGRCPNDCSFHGECQNGKCVCSQEYSGNDCSVPLVCPGNCGGASHGTCKNGVCECTAEFQGSDCSIPIGMQNFFLS